MELDPPLGLHAERLGHQCRLRQRAVDQDEGGRLPRAVELADESAEDRLGRLVGGVAGKERPVAVVLARAEEEDLHASLARLLVDGDDIRIAHGGQVDALAHLDVGKRLDAVTIGRGRLEFERVARRGHAIGKPTLDLPAAAREEGPRLLHQHVVVGFADPAHARRRATLDLILQARPRAAIQHRIRAGAQREGALERVDREVHGACGRERAEVIALPALGTTVLGNLRPAMAPAQQDVGERLVVAEQDVVVRLEPLDHVAFEQERLDFALRRDHLDRCGGCNHALQADGQRADVDVGRDPLLQALGLADVERLLTPVAHAVDTGAGRHGRQRGTQRCDTALQRDARIGKRRGIVRDGRDRPFDLHVHHRVIRLMRHVA